MSSILDGAPVGAGSLMPWFVMSLFLVRHVLKLLEIKFVKIKTKTAHESSDPHITVHPHEEDSCSTKHTHMLH
jgi:hypothetical protein